MMSMGKHHTDGRMDIAPIRLIGRDAGRRTRRSPRTPWGCVRL